MAPGLSAGELREAAAELAAVLTAARVLDVAPLGEAVGGGDDLLLVLQRDEAGGSPAKRFVHIALGSQRARVAPTTRRFRRDEQATGPRADALRKLLTDATVTGVEQAEGERRLALAFRAASGALRLQVELFSARGLWALCDDAGRILELSRPVVTAVRTLRPGDRYAPPPPRPGAAPAEPAPRFAPPVLAAIDAHFLALDRVAETAGDGERLRVLCDRAAARARTRADGLQEQLRQSEGAGALRQEGDLMLAYLHTAKRGAASMTVIDPDTGEDRVIELDPSKPVRLQAQARYDRARRLEDGRAIAAERLAQAQAEFEALTAVRRDLDGPTPDLDAARAALQALGAVPKPREPARQKPKPKAHGKPRLADENLRRFVSAEGYDLLVGRDNHQNDRLSMRIAKGNDLWLHVGGGRAGSHVVVRLPKGKTASLETLLDAGHLAVHFSKARGERAIDVIYTFAKNVRKPKGLPPGAVVPQQTRTLQVRLDEARLRRVLDSAPADDS
ncbi:MAG: NFACT RNA binding domain-containing protein [Planctomycetota bacterium]